MHLGEGLGAQSGMERAMIEEVLRGIEEKKLIQAGDFVLVGVSGGADSVCLLLLLLEYRRELAFSIQVVHVEHGIRGAESLEDARFVENLCGRLQVPCRTYNVDVPAYAKEHHMGLEEAARELRYDCFCRAAEEADAPAAKIALAHHADDNAETMLFQMVRGSGVRGLAGMRVKRELGKNLTLIRPLLNVTRCGIEEYLHARGESYRIDATNRDTDYSRNRIRHEVLPQLAQVNRQAVMHMAQSAGQLAELADYLDEEASRIAMHTCVKEKDACLIRFELFEKYPAVLQREVLYLVIGRMAGSRKDIGSVHIEEVKKLAALQVGRRISLPYELVAERVYEGIRIRGRRTGENRAVRAYEIVLEELDRQREGEWYVLSLPDGQLRMRVRDFCGETQEIHKKTYTKLLNYDKIKYNLQVRRRAGGDYLTIDEAGHKKKLREYFIEEKVPRERRDETWLLTAGDHVIWVVGGRISADYKIGPNTKKILEVQMSGGIYCEDQEY